MASISLQDGVMPSRAGNRFLLDNPNPAASGGGRRSLLNYNACGTGSAPVLRCGGIFQHYVRLLQHQMLIRVRLLQRGVRQQTVGCQQLWLLWQQVQEQPPV